MEYSLPLDAISSGGIAQIDIALPLDDHNDTVPPIATIPIDISTAATISVTFDTVHEMHIESRMLDELPADTTLQIDAGIGGETAAIAATIDVLVEESKTSKNSAVEGPCLDNTTSHIIFELQQQPLESILLSTKVQVDEKTAEDAISIQTSLSSLDVLIQKLSNRDPCDDFGTSPGFDTVDSNEIWRDIDDFNQYQILEGINISRQELIPMPSPIVALNYFLRIKDSWKERLEWARLSHDERKNVCSCIGQWQHKPSNNILRTLANQIIEQLMSQEASACLRSQPNIVRLWEDCYSPEKCHGPDEMTSLYLESSVRLLDSRDNYIQSYINCALKAQQTIDCCVCYVFYTDPAAKYVLLDLIPYIASRGVKVRVLFESMTLESQCLQSAFQEKKVESTESHCPIEESFLDNLPFGSPPFLRARKGFDSASELVQAFLAVASSISNIDCRFWLARDKRCHYRIKNHSKFYIFDGKQMNGAVIAGGSNIVPRGSNLDTDFVLQGEVAGMYQLHFDNLWHSMGPVGGFNLMAVEDEEEKKDHYDLIPTDGVIPADKNHGGSLSKILFVPSLPSSSGEDIILRCVLGAMKQAKESIIICMGHFNIPVAVAKVLKHATDTGVVVKVLANSLFSCDLRCGQRDLFKSLEQLLIIAPKVELFVTTVHDDTDAPPFLHSKYVIVDSEWVATGSWNLWTRSAFYEMEAEIFVSCKSFAAELRDKFERERSAFAVHVETPNECKRFLPKGCGICSQFGPFYEK